MNEFSNKPKKAKPAPKNSDSEEEEEKKDPYAGMDNEQIESKKIDDVLWDWKKLQQRYPSIQKRDYTRHSSLEEMTRDYDETLRELSHTRNVKNIRKYLIISWYGLEWICTKKLRIDLEGFAKAQIREMDEYNELLVELGDRGYASFGSELPIEVRLIFMVIFQAAMFYLMKKMDSGDGPNDGLMSMISMMVDKKAPAASTEQSKRIRRPTVTLDSITKENS